jgi:AcrR family transcriptional regulator
MAECLVGVVVSLLVGSYNFTKCKYAIGKSGMMIDRTAVKPAEGMRARKRRQTRERITDAAMTLFLERGFEAATVDDIAALADVSKRTFFDYFPTKEDVVFAWQEAFGEALAAAIAARPTDEALTKTVGEALISSIAAAAHPRAIAIDQLVIDTPALRARDQLKYARLEERLVEALTLREGLAGPNFDVRLLAMIVVGSLRLGSQDWRATGRRESAEAFTRQYSGMLWKKLREFAKAVVAGHVGEE